VKQIFAALCVFIGMSSAVVACPNFNMNGAIGSFTGDQLYSERTFRVQAGGSHNIQNCPSVRPRTDRGRGFVTTAPDFTIQVSGMSRYQLVMSVISECDSILLVNTGSVNWYYDDDDNGNLDARIVLTRPSNGIYDIWIGTHDGAVCNAQFSMETYNR
jgi:hypothetical protein